jgi:hypothetical protein
MQQRKITEYPFSVTRELSSWILGINPKIANSMIQGGILSYPVMEIDGVPNTKQFSDKFNQDCDDCFKNAYQQYETRLKALSSLSDTLNDLADQDYWQYALESFYTLVAFAGGVEIFTALGEAFAEFGATAAELARIEEIIARLKDHVKKAIQGNWDDVFYEQDVDTLWQWYKGNCDPRNWNNAIPQPGSRTVWKPVPGIPGGQQLATETYDADYIARLRRQCNARLRSAAANQTASSKFFRGVQELLNELFRILQQIARRNGMGLLKFIKILFGKILKYLGLLLQLFGLWGIITEFLNKMEARCKKNQEDQRDINAQRYLAADEYFRAVADCQNRGCCDEAIACKGVGGWCTRFRNGVDFSYYTPCCSGCDCGGDPDCYEAVCTQCDPARKCPNGGEIEEPIERDSLPNYLFPSTITKKDGCPPLPPGWQRLPDGVTPDARSSPHWDITPIPDCLVQDIKDFLWELWRNLGGADGTGGGGGVAVE